MYVTIYPAQSTVVLNANIAFLAIPYVGTTTYADVSQTLSYLSVLTSIGAAIFGLFLIRRYRPKQGVNMWTETVSFLHTSMLVFSH